MTSRASLAAADSAGGRFGRATRRSNGRPSRRPASGAPVRALPVFLGLFLGAPAHAQGGPPSGPPPANVVVDAVKFEPVEQWREVTGSLRALRRAVLASQEEGLVVELLRVEGDPVKAGEVIARLHDVRARYAAERAAADAQAAEAVVTQREADAERAQRNVDRMEEMIARDAGNEKEYDNIRTDFKNAAGRLAEARGEADSARAALRLAEQRLADMTIEAPFDGVVVVRRTEVGEWITAGGSVAEVVALDTVEARLDVPERYVNRLGAPGSPVPVRVTGDLDPAPGVLLAIVPDADAKSRLFPVRVTLANPDGRLRPGMSVTGLVPTGTTEPTFTVPKDAVMRNEAGEFVYLNDNGVARVVPIQRLFAVGGVVAIRPGPLEAGAQVVVEGNERLFPGQPLAIRPGSAPGAPGGR